jgi:hypothetical protein
MNFIKNIWAKYWGLKVWLRIVIAITVVAIVSSASGSGSTSTSSSEPSATSTAETEAAAEDVIGIGDTAHDGKFAFRVDKVKCGISKVGEYITSTAQGEYCAISITVQNQGDEPQTFFSSNLYLYNNKDQKYSNDTSAELSAGDSDVWMNEINPGNSVQGVIYFDVPKGTILDRLEVHDSAFSGGADISLK